MSVDAVNRKSLQCVIAQCRVTDILEQLAAGASQDEIFADFPYLEADDSAGSVLYVARRTNHPAIAAYT